MSLRSNMWSSATLEHGACPARAATLSLEADPELMAMKEELLVLWFAMMHPVGPLLRGDCNGRETENET